MAGRPRTMSNRVGRLLAQARVFHEGLVRVMPRTYAEDWYNPCEGDEFGNQWYYIRDFAESLIDSLETLDALLRAKVEHAGPPHSAVKPDDGDDEPEDESDEPPAAGL